MWWKVMMNPRTVVLSTRLILITCIRNDRSPLLLVAGVRSLLLLPGTNTPWVDGWLEGMRTQDVPAASSVPVTPPPPSTANPSGAPSASGTDTLVIELRMYRLLLLMGFNASSSVK